MLAFVPPAILPQTDQCNHQYSVNCQCQVSDRDFQISVICIKTMMSADFQKANHKDYNDEFKKLRDSFNQPGQIVSSHAKDWKAFLDRFQFPSLSPCLQQMPGFDRYNFHLLFGKIGLEWKDDFRDYVEIVQKVCESTFESDSKGFPCHKGIQFLTSHSHLRVAAALINHHVHLWIITHNLQIKMSKDEPDDKNMVLPNLWVGEEVCTRRNWVFKLKPNREIYIIKECARQIVASGKQCEIGRSQFPFPMKQIISCHGMRDLQDQRPLSLFAQEFYPKGDLWDYLCNNPAPPIEERVKICKQILADIWEPIFKIDLVHRDIKMENLICIGIKNQLPVCRAIDWAGAQIRNQYIDTDKTILEITPGYTMQQDFIEYLKMRQKNCQEWSKEECEAWWNLCKQHDCFLFGVVFFFICTWAERPPFHTITRRILFQENKDPQLVEVNEQALEKNQRYGDEVVHVFDSDQGLQDEGLREVLQIQKYTRSRFSGLHKVITDLLHPDRTRRATFEQAKKEFDSVI